MRNTARQFPALSLAPVPLLNLCDLHGPGGAHICGVGLTCARGCCQCRLLCWQKLRRETTM
jgi:hypothetical protein